MTKVDVRAAFAVIASLSAFACDKEGNTGTEGNDSSSQASGNDASAIVDAAQEAAEKATARSFFDKSLTKKACEILTPELVGKTFGVEADQLKQTKVMGCMYGWDTKKADPKEHFEARFTTIRTHKTEALAKRWFLNATKGMSKKETQEVMEKVVERTKEHKDVDTKMKKKAADNIGGLLANAAGEDGIQFEQVSGVGDEARINLSDGGLWIRVGNLTFVVSAFKGERQPMPDFKGVSPKEMAKLAMETNREWIKKTLPQRKSDGIKLGKAVIDALP